jgi:thioredoxin
MTARPLLQTLLVILAYALANQPAIAAEPVTDATFQQHVRDASADKPIVVFVWAPWCGPCRSISPELDKAIVDLGLTLVTLDVDENPTTTGELGVSSIPIILVFKNGEVVDQLLGAATGEIAEFLKTHVR